MPIYSFKCPACEGGFDLNLPMSEAKNPQACPECGVVSQRVLGGGVVDFALNGDQWPGKAIKVRGQMAEKNRKLGIRQKEHHATVKLAPNVGGERVDSWSEAKRLAKDRGKETTSYDSLIRKEGGSA